jgi:hypothetical protein
LATGQRRGRHDQHTAGKNEGRDASAAHRLWVSMRLVHSLGPLTDSFIESSFVCSRQLGILVEFE